MARIIKGSMIDKQGQFFLVHFLKGFLMVGKRRPIYQLAISNSNHIGTNIFFIVLSFSGLLNVGDVIKEVNGQPVKNNPEKVQKILVCSIRI